MEKSREAGRSLTKKRKEHGQKRIIVEHLTDPKRATFVILKNYASTHVRQERWSLTSKERREVSRKSFVKKAEVPGGVKSLEKSIIARIARSGFVKPIRNGLRKINNLIQSRPSRAETGMARRFNGIRFQKEELMR